MTVELETAADPEIRLALAMNGGVSLAVWIGGVSDELLRLCRAAGAHTAEGRSDGFTLSAAAPDPAWSPYQIASWIARARPRVDVMSGASAGGMNAVFLALGLVYGHADLRLLRDLWLEAGSFDALLRNPTSHDPPSLLKGDAYFLPKLHDAIRSLMPANVKPVDPAELPLDVTLTVTALDGGLRHYTTTYGTSIAERDHRGEFRFRHRATRTLGQHGSDFTPAAADADGANVVDRETVIARLARACRSTASFPGAFEPSLVGVSNEATSNGAGFAAHQIDTTLRDLTRVNGETYVIDGGTLVNLPVEEAITAIFEQPASGAVRRVFAMVVPDPPIDPATQPPSSPMVSAAPGARPLRNVIGDALSTIPRNQTVGQALDDLQLNNERLTYSRVARLAILDNTIDGLDDLGRRAFGAYRARRRATSNDALREHLDARLRERRTPVSPARRTDWLQALTAFDPPWLPTSWPFAASTDTDPDTAPDPDTDTDTDTAPASVSAGTDGAPADTATGPTVPADLNAWGRTTVRRCAARVLHLLGVLDSASSTGRGERGVIVDGMLAPDRLGAWRRRTTDIVAAKGPLSLAAQNNLLAAADLSGDPTAQVAMLRTEWAAGRVDITADLIELGTVLDEAIAASAARPELPRALHSVSAGSGLRILLALEVIENGFGGFEHTVEQLVETIRIDSLSCSPIDPLERNHAAKKVVGVQLAHFASFLKESWRANDWMWGRLDGSADLIDVMLDRADPSRVAAAAAALGVTADGVRDELVSRLHTTVVFEETPVLLAAAANDREAGGANSRTITELARQWEAVKNSLPDVAKATELLRSNRVGEETVAGQTGSELMTRISLTAAATGATVLHGTSPKLLKTPIRIVRYAALGAWAMTRAWFGGPTTRALAAMAFGIGATLISVELATGDLPQWLVLVALALFVSGTLVAAARAWKVTAAILLAVALPVGLSLLPAERWHWWPRRLPFPTLHDARDKLAYLVIAAAIALALIGGAGRRVRRAVRSHAR